MAVAHIEIACEVLRETGAAFHICDGVTTCWVPKSQVEHHPETDPRKRSCVMVMPEWLARDKGLI